MKIYLLRHAERNHGEEQDTLTETGYFQAEHIKNHLKKLSIQKVYCASTNRSKETIKPFLKDFKGIIEYTSDLDEMRLGILKGKTAQDLRDAIVNSGLSKEQFRPEDGENIEDFTNRIKNFIKKLRNEKYERILLSTHAGVIRNFIEILIGLPREEIPKTDFASLSYIELDKNFNVLDYKLNQEIVSKQSD